MNIATQARIDRIVNMTSDYLTPGRAAALREIVEYILKEQDKDTRHACAEAILDLPHDMTHTDAQRACMNVKAV